MVEDETSDTAKRFGARYGRKIRKKVSEVESDSKSSYECPNCRVKSLERSGTGIWKCNKCGEKVAGGAYKPQTPVGETVKRTLREEIEEEEE